MRRILERLSQPVDGATLAAFRIGFAIVMFADVAWAWYSWRTSEVQAWLAAEFRPIYSFTPFLEGWSLPNPDVVNPVMLVALAALALGLFTRVSAIVFGAVFAYVEVLDPARFNNHTYLIALLAFLLAATRSNAVWSLDARWFGSNGLIPFWHQVLIRFQLCVVYFYGGLAKLNSDWLVGEPVIHWVRAEADHPTLGWLFAQPWVGYAVGYVGIVFDLFIALFLLWKPTRLAAMALTFVFHMTNMQLFNIGVFPWLGMASLVIFFDPATPRVWLDWLRTRDTRPGPDGDGPRTSPLLVAAVAVFVVAQLTVPFRHLLYPGWVEWNAVGKQFSWRMMLSSRRSFVGMQVVDRGTGRAYEVDQGGQYIDLAGLEPGTAALRVVDGTPVLIPSKLLVQRTQLKGKGVWGSPLLLAQYARAVAADARRLGLTRPGVRVDAVMSLNGRPFQYLVDPRINLAGAPIPVLGTPKWIVPMKPNQPIGNYPANIQEFHDRVMAVINAFRQRQGALP